MNKYQEALKEIENKFVDKYLNGKIDEDGFNKLVGSMDELVKRATPKKPIYVNRGHECPTCSNCDIEGELGYQYKYCSECGQAIDWSKNE